MTSNEFLQQANNSAVINAFLYDPEAKQHVKNFAHSKRVKTLLYIAGTRILNLLLKILENQIINKYGTPKK